MIELPEIRGEYRHNFTLSPLTWFKVGGKAEVLFKPADINDLSFFLTNIAPDIPINVIGACSNLIIRDGGVEGVVIKLGKGFTDIAESSSSSSLLTVGAGTLNYNLAQYALQNSLQGFEFLVGIPGTIGGGIAMNAGSYGSEFKDILHSITRLDRAGTKHILLASEMGFEYRRNGLKDCGIFVEATFSFGAGEKEKIKSKMDEITNARKSTQPVNQKTSGSTFANPGGYKAWELIDQAGMRGFTIGGAQFSPLHCNFMVNTGSASASELEELGEMARSKVFEQTGIDLHWEIKRIGRK